MSNKRKQNTAIILAAGKGTRMKSALPKVLHPIANEPMLGHVMHAAKAAGCEHQVIVTSPDMSEVANYAVSADEGVRIVHQAEQLGTGHAVMAAKETLQGHDENVIVLFADSPLILPETIEAMQRQLSKNPKLAVVVLGFDEPNPPAYGRLVLAPDGELLEIVEDKDATPEQLEITLCNAGVMAIRGHLLWEMCSHLTNDNAQGEYYLTDLVAIARHMGYACAVYAGDATEALGVNSRAQLAQVEAIMQNRLREAAMAQGVTMTDPSSVFLSADTQFGQDVTLQPNVFFGAGVAVGDNVEIRANSHIEGAVIGDGAVVGPFARLRPGANIGAGCKIGNFVEIKKAQLEAGAKVSHLSYIGDAHIGENANIGAGTITCNYDGYKKYHTEIGADVFIGSNSALVAPISIGDGAIVGAGSVITEDVKPDALALARGRQSQKDDWAEAFKARMKS
jgi:bifunctional UDP-N-acetylglucosamine pyrophosphorylase/glucosamine-1-phosphate N-acetyltransferase